MPHSVRARADRQATVIDRPKLFVRQVVTSDLSLASQAVLLTIVHYAWWGERTCYASGRTIARDVGISERHVRRIIPDLEARGLIRVERRTGSARSRYDITLGPCIHQVGRHVPLRLHEVGHDGPPGRTCGPHEVGHQVRALLSRMGEDDGCFSPPEGEQISPAFARFFGSLLPPGGG